MLNCMYEYIYCIPQLWTLFQVKTFLIANLISARKDFSIIHCWCAVRRFNYKKTPKPATDNSTPLLGAAAKYHTASASVVVGVVGVVGVVAHRHLGITNDDCESGEQQQNKQTKTNRMRNYTAAARHTHGRWFAPSFASSAITSSPFAWWVRGKELNYIHTM